MSISFEICIVAAAVLLYFDILLICRLIIKRLKIFKLKEISIKKKDTLLNAVVGTVEQYDLEIDTGNYFEMKQAIQLDKLKREAVEKFIDIAEFEKTYIKKLKGFNRVTRINAAVNLGLIASDNARRAMEKAILEEQEYTVKLYLANALSDINSRESIPVLVSSLIGSHRWYRDRVNMLLADFGEAFNAYLPEIIESEKIEIKELIIDFAGIYFSETLRNYLINIVETREEAVAQLESLYGKTGKKACSNCTFGSKALKDNLRLCKFKGVVEPEFSCYRYKTLPVSMNSAENYMKLVYKAADTLAAYYPKVLDDDRYLNSTDIGIRNIAVKALSNLNSHESINKLINFIRSDSTARSAINSISRLIEGNAEHIQSVVSIFTAEKDIKVRQRLAEVLSGKIEYFIMKLTTKNGDAAAEIIKQILLLGKTSEVVNFLNKNKDTDMENELAYIIKQIVPFSTELEKELCTYLNERVCVKCGLVRCEELLAKKEEKKNTKLIRTLYSIMVMIVMLFPIIYAIRHFSVLFHIPIFQQVKIFVVDFNYYLAFYSIAINLIYIILLVLSNFNVRKQFKLWKVKCIPMLFKKKMLPSISIIAPAFNEEKTIIESTNSLLNLKYPDYELILVNDGSKDGTLDVLIQNYDLIRVDYMFEYKLKTRAVRGVYMNRSMPKLIVVDKENGGKADSLNAGINISNKEYFCGIDADSLLEDEALLKLASLTLDEGCETPALGGNIFPINGCSVERGQIKNIRIPGNTAARFQTIEYIRAFMAGRLGWAYLNSLLIISGAFGLFRKERVISVGGYLTSSGKYEKDTVGEDMELVVRISRLMSELKQKFRICYAFNANCWTEVPEDLKSLKRQRYRWHRGLIDILTFHKKMIFNPGYGRIGLVAMPYFFIFEMIGPIIEIQGYMMVIAALILGLLNAEIALLLFISTVFMGVLVSISSLIIAEKDMMYFNKKDIMVLILYSIIENFGPRQLFSLWRVGGYLNMLKKPTGWGKLERKGFAASNNSVKA